MINLTRLNGQSMAVNPDLLKFIEASPDTVITLITGEKVVVTETPDEVISRVLEYKRSIFSSYSTTPNIFCSAKIMGAESQKAAEEL